MNWWNNFYIINAHAHVHPIDQVFKVEMSVKQLKKLMNKYNYSQCIIMDKDNEAIENAVKDSVKLLANVWVNPKEKGFKNILRTYLVKENFVGIKLHPLMDGYLPSDPLLNPVMEVAEDFDVPVQIHCGHPPFSLPWSFEPLARNFSKVRIILLHMGHGHVVYINGTIDVAERNQNIYLETSGMPMHTKILEAVKRVGCERILYGDDLPCGHPSWELEKARAAGLSDNDFKRFLGENAKILYKID